MQQKITTKWKTNPQT